MTKPGKTRKPNIKYIVLNFGYVEEAYLSSLILSNPSSKFKSKRDALKDCTDQFLDIFKEKYEYNDALKKCCRETFVQDNSNRFCSKCGGSLAKAVINIIEFSDFAAELGTATADTCGEIFYERWQPSNEALFAMNKHNTVVIDERAEEALTYLAVEILNLDNALEYTSGVDIIDDIDK